MFVRLVKRKLKQFKFKRGPKDVEMLESWKFITMNASTHFAGHQTPDDTFVVLNRLRAKIVNLHGVRLQKVLRDTNEPDRQPKEQQTLFHVLRMQKRRSARVIRHIQDEEGRTHKTQLPIMRVFMTHFRKKYDIEVNDGCIITMAVAIPQPPDITYMEHLNLPIDIEEIRQALLAGRRQKAP